MSRPADPGRPDDGPGVDLARPIGDTDLLLASPAQDAAGAVWRLEPAQRQLDANVIRLRPNSEIASHVGPDLDVLMHVLGGSGELVNAAETVQIAAGTLVWLPRRSQRAIHAGPDGLSYLTVHQRRPALGVTGRAQPDGRH